MNLQSLLHLTTLARLFAAMRQAVSSRRGAPRSKGVRGVANVFNAKGKLSITVCYLVGEAAWSLLGVSSGFYFIDAKGKNITALVLRALRGE